VNVHKSVNGKQYFIHKKVIGCAPSLQSHPREIAKRIGAHKAILKGASKLGG
jgi:hypothetical protein